MDPIQYAICHCILGGQRDFRACSRPPPGSRQRWCRGRNRLPVRSHRSRRAGRPPCARACACPAASASCVSAANPTSTWSGRRRAARPARMSGVGSRTMLGNPVLLRELGAHRALRAEIRHGGRHDHDVGLLGRGPDRVLHVGGGLHVDPADRADRRRKAAPAATTVTSVTMAPRRAAATASAWPCLPEDRFEMKRTGSSGSRVPPELTTTCRPCRSRRVEPRRAARATRVDDHRRIGEPALSRVAAGQPAALGRDDLDAASLAGRPGSRAPRRAPTSRCAWRGRR